MQDLQEKKVLLITFVILLLGFFSASFTGLHHAGSGSAGIGVYGGQSLDKQDVKLALSFIAQDKFKKSYDLNDDRKLDENDVTLIRQRVKIPSVRADACKVGQTRCSRLGNVLACQEGEFKNENEWVEIPCPERGQKCGYHYPNLATGIKAGYAECRYGFSG